ncbi:MAG: prolyl oligopeptidase family serine peptidase [Candidatus Xenobia bacterium]
MEDKNAATVDYPRTRQDDVRDTLHGVEVADPYRWLEDVKAAEVQDWMTEQDDLARAWLKQCPYRQELADRLKQLFYLDTIGAPVHRGTRYFYGRRHATKEKSVVYWKEGKDGAERVLFDPNTWSEDGSVSLRGYQISHDGCLVAYEKSVNNSDEATMYVRDLATDTDSTVDVIEGAKYGAASWTPQGDAFYYTWLPPEGSVSVADRPGYAEVRYHKLGTDPAQDKVIHPRTGDPTCFIGADISRDGHWLFVVKSHGWNTTDIWYQDLRPGSQMKEFAPLVVGKASVFSVWAWEDRFYIHTNWGAPKWRLFRTDPEHLVPEQWTEIVPERADATLESFTIVGGRLALDYLKDVSSYLEIRELDGRFVREVKLPGIGSVSGILGNEDEDEAYYAYDSFTVPREIYQTSIATGETSLWFRLSIPVDPSLYTAEQVWYHSKDGTKVPMFVIHRKDIRRDGSHPTILNGYGGFQVSLAPHFDPSIFPWLEHGGIHAIANLRGGAEFGEAWHQAGVGVHKQNVFDDFIAAAEYLIAQGYTRPEKLAIEGGSNGGLLVGAAETQRPDLFRVVLCAVPLLDMVRYHLFGSGKTWISEYGSADEAEFFSAIHAYSPYHHVQSGVRYPSTLLLSADSDDRVDPMHARKFAAMLQARSAGGPVLLRIERHAGHGGADLIKAAVEKWADMYAFTLSQMQ